MRYVYEQKITSRILFQEHNQFSGTFGDTPCFVTEEMIPCFGRYDIGLGIVLAVSMQN
jgi:hypothetical protein